MRINKDEKFGVPTNYFGIGATTGGYTLEFSADGENWTSIEKDTPANEVHIVSGCPKNMFWRLRGNTEDNVLIKW